MNINAVFLKLKVGFLKNMAAGMLLLINFIIVENLLCGLEVTYKYVTNHPVQIRVRGCCGGVGYAQISDSFGISYQI